MSIYSYSELSEYWKNLQTRDDFYFYLHVHNHQARPEQDEVASAIRFQGPCIGYGPISLVRLLMLMLLLMVTLGQCRSHQHLFPIRSLKSLPSDLSGLNRLGLVDAQRRDRIGPAEPLLDYAKRITVVDHHLDSDSDIQSNDYILDKVGSVST
jgi:hypothetical protein